MNAKPRDVQAGWEIFKQSNFAATIEQVTAELQKRAFNPISERTYTHYRKLARYGYERYVPINRLDVETLRDPVWGSPLMSRYRTRRATVAVILVAIYKGELVNIAADTEEVGESEARLVVTAKSSRDLLAADPTGFEGLDCLIDFTNLNLTRSAQIDLIEPSKSAVGITVSFMELVPTPEITGREPLDPASMRLTLVAHEDDYFVNLVRILHSLFEATDSARIVCDEVLAQLDTDGRFVLSPPRVGLLSKSSPLVAELGTSWPPLLVFAGLVTLYIRWWKGQNEGRLVRKQGDEVAAKADYIAEQTRTLRIRNDLNEFRNTLLSSGTLPTFIIDSVRRSLPEELRDGPVKDERLQSLIERQLLPAVERVIDQHLEELEVETDRVIDVPGDPPGEDEAPAQRDG